MKPSLLGGLEIYLFMDKGVERFGNARTDALHSFLVPALIFPLSLVIVNAIPQTELAGLSLPAVAGLFALRTAVTLALMLAVTYGITRGVARTGYFYRFVTAFNWLEVPGFILSAPIALLIVSGAYSHEELYGFMVIILLHGYAAIAFMSSRALKLPLELGGFLAIILMFLQESGMDAVRWIGAALSA